MTTWVYHLPDEVKPLPKILLPGPGKDWDRKTETLGARQAQLLLRARKSQGGLLVLTHDRASNRDRMAARRLVERELLAGPNWRGDIRNWRGQALVRNVTGLYVYTLTSRGRSCWVRVKEEK